MSSNDIADWFRRIPQITKYWFTGSIALPLIGKLGLVSTMSMILDFNSVVYGFQVRILFWQELRTEPLGTVSVPSGSY
jgi:derlin-1